jgi:uroporphyrinogen-III decarboxylase
MKRGFTRTREIFVGPGCALDPNVPDDNIHTLVESVKKYGVH